MQGMRNVLANERLFLPAVDMAIDFLRVVHEGIMTVQSGCRQGESRR